MPAHLRKKHPISTIAIDHVVIPAVAEAGGPVAAYAGFDYQGGADRLLGIECSCATSVADVARAGVPPSVKE